MRITDLKKANLIIKAQQEKMVELQIENAVLRGELPQDKQTRKKHFEKEMRKHLEVIHTRKIVREKKIVNF